MKLLAIEVTVNRKLATSLLTLKPIICYTSSLKVLTITILKDYNGTWYISEDPQSSIQSYFQYVWFRKERKVYSFLKGFVFFFLFTCSEEISLNCACYSVWDKQISSVQSLSCVQLLATPWIAARQASLSIINSWSSLKLMSIESMMPSSHLILCHPLLLPPSLPASESFPLSQFFAWGGQSIGVSTLASALPKDTRDWSPLEWTGWISLQSKGLSRVFSNTTVQKHQFFRAQLSSQSSHPYMTTGKTIALARGTFVGKVMSLLLKMLSRLVITFHPRSKRLLISWLQSPSAVILEPLK